MQKFSILKESDLNLTLQHELPVFFCSPIYWFNLQQNICYYCFTFLFRQKAIQIHIFDILKCVAYFHISFVSRSCTYRIIMADHTEAMTIQQWYRKMHSMQSVASNERMCGYHFQNLLACWVFFIFFSFLPHPNFLNILHPCCCHICGVIYIRNGI